MKVFQLIFLLLVILLITCNSINCKSKVLANPWVRKCSKTPTGVKCSEYVPKLYKKIPPTTSSIISDFDETKTVYEAMKINDENVRKTNFDVPLD